MRSMRLTLRHPLPPAVSPAVSPALSPFPALAPDLALGTDQDRPPSRMRRYFADEPTRADDGQEYVGAWLVVEEHSWPDGEWRVVSVRPVEMF